MKTITKIHLKEITFIPEYWGENEAGEMITPNVIGIGKLEIQVSDLPQHLQDELLQIVTDSYIEQFKPSDKLERRMREKS